jgi:hypothetical protein
MRFLRDLLIFFIFFLNLKDGICGWKYFGQFGHMVIDPQYGHAGRWNSDGDGRSKENRYSLMWDEEVCKSKVKYDIGYFKNSAMDPENPNGSFTPRLRLRHGMFNPVLYRFPFNWKDACTSWSGGYDDFVVSTDIDKVECRRSGLSDALRVCFTAKVAPYSKRTLYPWLAQIQVGLNGKKKTLEENPSSSDNSKGRYLKDVILRNPDVIESGFKDFKNIDMDWVNKISLKTNENQLRRYTAKFIGQKMVCASLVGADNGDERCSTPQQCLRDESLDLLIKCVLVPLGPPPHPFTDYIVGANPVYSVYHLGSTYDKPKARIIYFVKDGDEFKKYSTNCEGIGGNGLKDGANSCKGGPGETYSFSIDVTSDFVCSKLDRIGARVVNYDLGCYPRGGGALSPLPVLDSVPQGSMSDQNVNLAITYPWKKASPIATIQPINEVRFLDFELLKDGIDFYDDGGENKFLTAFQNGFVRNPYNKDFDFSRSIKKECKFLNINGDNGNAVIRYIDINSSCESLPEMVTNTSINMYQCNSDGVYASSISGPGSCTDMGLLQQGSTPILGIKCKNGALIKAGGRCEDVFVNLFYDHDPAGQKICLRNFNGGEEWKSVVRDVNGEKRILSFIENDKVLMKLKDDGSIDFDNPEFRTFNNFTVDELDYLRSISGFEFVYKKDDKEVRYKYGPKVVPIVTAQDSSGKDIITETTFRGEDNKPFVVSEEEILRRDVYDGNPDAKGLCVPVKSNVFHKKEWEYVLQMPGYYSNYDITSDTDITVIKAKLEAVPGGIAAKNIVNNPINFDGLQSNTILIPTEYAKLAATATPTKDAVVGISDKRENRVVSAEDLKTKVSSSLNLDIESFNFYPDFFNKIIKSGKILYLNGIDLKDPFTQQEDEKIKMSKNLFDTSKCDVIDFEIWGGGGSSRATKQANSGVAGTNLFDFTLVGVDVNGCNTNSSGQNGAYIKGRFKIRPNSKLKMLVGSVAGNEADVPSLFDSSSLDLRKVNELQNSAIWVTDSIETIRIAANGGSNDHDCAGSGATSCKNLKENELVERAIDNGVNLVEPESGAKASLKRYNINGNFIKSLEREFNQRDKSFDENEIQIDSYRNVSMSSYCGSTFINLNFDLFATLPLSYPINVNEYLADNPYDISNKKGYRIEKGIVNLTKNGSGKFSDIGSYNFINILQSESASSTSFGFNIHWRNRKDGNVNYGKCESRIKACYGIGKFADGITNLGGGEKILVDGDKLMYGGNSTGVLDKADRDFFVSVLLNNTIDPNMKKDLITDANIYCPGMGGCYFSDDKKGISQPGTNGLIKVKCFRM